MTAKREQHQYQQKGFTLVELMVVVIIIGILVAISLAAYGRMSNNARRAECRSNQRGVLQSAYVYSMDFEIPDGFSIRDYMGQEPWDYSNARPSSVEIRMSTARYEQARARWEDRDDVTFGPVRERTVAMKVRDDAAFLRWVLSQQGEVEILAPRRLRREMRRLIERVVAIHTTPGEEG